MWAAEWALIIDTCLCVCVNGRYHVLVPAEWLSAGLIRPRPQTQSLSYSLSGLRVPVRRLKRFTGAERLLEVEFQQPDMEFTQVSAEFVCIFENWMQWKRSVSTLKPLTGSDGQTETYKVVVPALDHGFKTISQPSPQRHLLAAFVSVLEQAILWNNTDKHSRFLDKSTCYTRLSIVMINACFGEPPLQQNKKYFGMVNDSNDCNELCVSAFCCGCVNVHEAVSVTY